MEKTPDWLLLWRQVSEIHEKRFAKEQDASGNQDAWKDKARSFHASVKKRWDREDSSRRFILGQLKEHPGSTVLDIGAGTGAWTCLMAPHARSVTALEPSPAMAAILKENLDEQRITNVEIIPGAWPDAEVARHDFTLCSHAMYSCPDFKGFVGRMGEVTARMCILLMRAPLMGSVMAELSQAVRGHPHDSPNFHIAYNALLQIDIFASVIMEDTGLWDRPWTNESIEEASGDVKRKLGLPQRSEFDEYIREILEHRLSREDGRYVWPSAVRSALVYWDVNAR